MWGAERNFRRLAENEEREGSALSFKAYRQPIVMMYLFFYLFQTLLAVDEKWQAVVNKICKARKVWDRLLRILGREGGIISEDVGAILHHDCSGETDIFVGDLGGDPPYSVEPGGVSQPGGAENHREATEATVGWEMGIPPNVGGAKGVRDRVFGGLHKTETEHGGTVHLHPEYHGPLTGSI